MTHVDIAADLNCEDESGVVWTFLDEAREPAVIRAREIVAAGTGRSLRDDVEQLLERSARHDVPPARTARRALCIR